MSAPTRHYSRWLMLVAVVALSAGPSLQSRQTPIRQPPGGQPTDKPPATGVISGQVLDAGTGRPISGAIVSLTINPLSLAATGISNTADILEMAAVTGPSLPVRVITNADGRFVYRNLPKGRFSFSASASGYLLGSYGQRRAGGPGSTLELEDGEKLLDAVFRLWKAATISGAVTDEVGEPVVGIGLRVLRRGIVAGRTRWSTGLTATTDDRGVYRFPNLTPGDYTVAAVSTTSSVPATMLEAYREAITAVGLSGSTNNLIRDLSASGAPLPTTSGTRVGDQVLQQSTFGRIATPPAVSDTGKMLSYPTTYHPGSISPSQLTVITVESGEDRTGVDLQLRLVPTVKVSGIVNGPDGPVASIGVRLLPAGIDEFSSELGLDTALTATDGRGAFTFLGVPAGVYSVKVLKTPRPAIPTSSEGMVIMSSGSGMSIATSIATTAPPPAPLPNEPTLWGATSVTVGEVDVNGVSVTLRTGARVTGRVEFDGTRPPPTADQVQRISITLQPVDLRTVSLATPGRVTPDLQFRTMGFAPGRYLVSAGGAGADWTLKSAMLGGRDVADEPLEVGGEDVGGLVLIFSDHPAQLSGTVRNTQSQADADAEVLVFPANHLLWKEVVNPRRARSTRTTKTGAYTLQGLPPGDYYVVAISSTTSREWQDPKFLEAAAPLATRVTILDGDKKVQDLRTARLR